MGNTYKCYLKEHSNPPYFKLYLHYDDDSGELYLIEKVKVNKRYKPKLAIPLPTHKANTIYFMLEGVFHNMDIFNADLPRFGEKPKKGKFNWKPTNSFWD